MTDAYYDNVNADLLRWMPLCAREVLEIGCGEGALAAAYRRRNPGVRYTAVESHAPAAAIARTRVDALIEADFETLSDDNLGAYDVIVLGDVLEHLADPWAALGRLRGRLRPGGWLALSVPNVGHWSVLAEVISGRWPARDSGLFDRTHLRWFTLDSLRSVLGESGLRLHRARPRTFLLDREAAARWIPILADAAERAGQDRRAFERRSQTLQWVVNAGSALEAPAEPLHLHFAAVTPDFLDVRMRLPAEALGSDPTLTVSYAEKTARLPDLPPDRPKVAVVQRLALASPEVVARYVEEAEAAGWVLAFEIDDDPDLIGRVQRSRVGERLDWTLRGFHALQTSTAPLGEALRGRNPELAVFPNAILEPPARPAAPRRLRVFHGALNREGFTGRVAARLGEVAERRPEVEFVVLHDRAFFEALPAANKSFHRAAGYPAYLEAMAGCDVVLSPLEGAPSELYKSDVKFIEAAAAGCAMVASPAVYARTVRDGETGLIAETLDDWPRQLGRLLADDPLRRRLAAAASAYVRAERMLATQVAPRADWYRALWRDRERLAAAARRRREAAPAAERPAAAP